MGDIKPDVKVSVKVFTQTAVSSVVRESTQKLLKGLTESQKKVFEARIRNMSDAQLEQYFENDPYFKKALEHTIKSVNDIPPENVPGFWMENFQSVYEDTYSKDLKKILFWPAPRVILAIIVCIALLAMIGFSMVNDGEKPPVANFSSNLTSGSAPLPVQFTDLSKNTKEWNWDFGDGANSTQQNPTHTYSTAGSYTVTLTVTNKNGTNSINYTITVSKPPPPSVLPVANFISNVTQGSAPLSVQFTDLSKNAKEWKWDFGDGTNLTQQNSTHNYSKAGILHVENFSSSVINYCNLPISFLDRSGNAIERNLDFGDNNSSPEQNPTHTYSTAGNYTVTLTVTNGIYKNSTLRQINVPKPLPPPDPPVADFIYNVTRGNPLSVQFTDLSKNAKGWNWDFGDGTNSTWKNTTYTYSTAGNYNVNLTVFNSNGTDSKLANITVYKPPSPPPPDPPVADFIYNVTRGNPLSVQFTDLSKNAKGWNWDFGDEANSTQQNPTHTYSTLGIYTVALTATNTDGADSKSATIEVTEDPGQNVPPVLPVANFISNVTQGNPLSVQFTDLSENATEWNWDFGDEANSPTQNPTHTYSTAGIYNVNLTAINKNGTNSINYTITVPKPPPPPPPSVFPVANFISNVTQGYVPLSVQFTDLSENATEWNWDFGEGVPSTQQNPMHTYSTAGIYNVNLTAITKNGTNSTHATITVQKFPDTPDPDMPYALYITNSESNNVSVINTSTDNITATVPVGTCPWGVAVTPDGKKVYVVNHRSDNVSVIDTATNKVIATVPVGSYPWGVAISQAGTKVYVANSEGNNVSVIDTATNKVIATVPVGSYPWGVAVNQAGTKVYVANSESNNVSVIDTATNTVTSTVPVGSFPEGVAVNQAGTIVYVANSESSNISVIDTATNTVTDNVPVGSRPRGVAVTPDGTKVYVANYGSNNVSVIDTATNTVTARVPVGSCPKGVAVTPDGKMVYVANYKSKNISVIDTENNTVIDNVPLESNPIAFGQFIGPLQY
ncbi:PKD domain-containing protein [Methanosarcina sp. Mfa9]|uniref:PKD domain-containing protein n=1 Tax=Methanosarcina sp. Mfa9 TaxID=3439063 RepID=UPI003F84346C